MEQTCPSARAFSGDGRETVELPQNAKTKIVIKDNFEFLARDPILRGIPFSVPLFGDGTTRTSKLLHRFRQPSHRALDGCSERRFARGIERRIAFLRGRAAAQHRVERLLFFAPKDE